MEEKNVLNSVEELKFGVTYSHEEVSKFCVLYDAENRPTNANSVKKIAETLKRGNCIMNPIIITTAEKMKAEGRKLVDASRKPVDYSQIDPKRTIIIVDGQHRDEATRKMIAEFYKDKNNVGKPHPFKCRYTLLDPDCKIGESLQDANEIQVSWSMVNFLPNLTALAKDKGAKEMLQWVYNSITDKTAKDVAAWLWATLDNKRVYPKAAIIKAINDANSRDSIFEHDNFEKGKQLFEAFRGSADKNASEKACKFKKSVMLKAFPLWVIDKLNYLLRKNLRISDAIQRLIDFANAIPIKKAQEIDKMKGLSKKDGKTLYKELDALYNTLMNNDGTLKTAAIASETPTEETTK